MVEAFGACGFGQALSFSELSEQEREELRARGYCGIALERASARIHRETRTNGRLG